MSIFIATGSNLGDSLLHLANAKKNLCQKFTLIAESQIYYSPPVGYTDQPNFYNQVLEFEDASISPHEIIKLLLQIETEMGRVRNIKDGPRIIDIDFLFYHLEQIKLSDPELIIPHPRLFERSFVILPLMELPGFQMLKKHFTFKTEQFDSPAWPYKKI